MRLISTLFILLVVAVVIAAFTFPGDKKFQQFIDEKTTDPMATKPIIAKTSSIGIFGLKLFTFYNVSYIEGTPEAGGQDSTTTAKKLPSYKLKMISNTEKWMGLYGKFWKLKSEGAKTDSLGKAVSY